ncbi:MAG TPA: hypothetical protein VMI53_14900 [Opitutaceae bacterium]|nr:hypothetical protein [Opitutaceae bacterium]
MPLDPFHLEFIKPTVDHRVIAELVARQPKFLPRIFNGLHAEKARVKYGCLKVLRAISETDPVVLYPEFERLLGLLESEKAFMKWGGIIIIGNLAAVDAEGKIARELDRYLRPIFEHELITACNVIGGAAKIARMKPELADKIAGALLQVEQAHYQTAECRNVALGHAVQSLDLFFEHIQNPTPVLAFVERQLDNRRNAVKRKAEAFLKRHPPHDQSSRGANGHQPFR